MQRTCPPALLHPFPLLPFASPSTRFSKPPSRSPQIKYRPPPPFPPPIPAPAPTLPKAGDTARPPPRPGLHKRTCARAPGFRCAAGQGRSPFSPLRFLALVLLAQLFCWIPALFYFLLSCWSVKYILLVLGSFWVPAPCRSQFVFLVI